MFDVDGFQLLWAVANSHIGTIWSGNCFEQNHQRPAVSSDLDEVERTDGPGI